MLRDGFSFLVNLWLENGVMMTSRCWLLTLIFVCLCFKISQSEEEEEEEFIL